MTKDNLISAVFGILLGFIAGYLMHEVMASRQPPRFAGNAAGTGMMETPPVAAQQQQQQQQQQQEMAAAAAQERQEIQQLEQYLQEHPNDAQAVRRLGDLNFDLEQWGQARDFYSRFLQLQPGNVDVTSDLGVVYRGLKEYEKALAQFDEAQRLAPDHWQSLYNKVIVLLDLQRFDEAQQVMAALQKLQPGNPNVAGLAAQMEKQRKAA